MCITDTGRRHLAEGKGKALRSRRDSAGIRLLTHVAQEWTERYPAVVAAMDHFPCSPASLAGEGTQRRSAGWLRSPASREPFLSQSDGVRSRGRHVRSEHSMLQYGLAITLVTLSVLGMASAEVAAPYSPKSRQCYGACTAKCAVQHSCVRSDASRDCFTHYNQCKAACRIECDR